MLLQGYPNLEYIVIDGGSSDNSVEVIRKYQDWIKHWVSEKDAGQADAINKGLARCSGEVFQFINSDDYLASGALRAVSEAIDGNHAVAGGVTDFEDEGLLVQRKCRALAPVNFILRPEDFLYHQPGVWLRTEFVKALGGFETRWRYKFDWVLQIRYAERWPRFAYVDDTLAYFRLHPGSKTMSEGRDFWEEELVARDLLCHSAVDPALRVVLNRFVRHHHWRLRVDELMAAVGQTPRQAGLRLLAEAFRDPLHRIDRYSLGGIRRLLFESRASGNS